MWLTMVPYPLRFAMMDSDGLLAAYRYTLGSGPSSTSLHDRPVCGGGRGGSSTAGWMDGWVGKWVGVAKV